MTPNGVGSRTRLRLPAGEPRRRPVSRAHRCGPTERGAALQPSALRGHWAHGTVAFAATRASSAAAEAGRPRSA